MIRFFGSNTNMLRIRSSFSLSLSPLKSLYMSRLRIVFYASRRLHSHTIITLSTQSSIAVDSPSIVLTQYDRSVLA